MKNVKIVSTIAVTGATFLLFGCSANLGLNRGWMGFWDDGIVSTYVTTTPVGVRLNLINIDRGIDTSFISR